MLHHHNFITRFQQKNINNQPVSRPFVKVPTRITATTYSFFYNQYNFLELL